MWGGGGGGWQVLDECIYMRGGVNCNFLNLIKIGDIFTISGFAVRCNPN